MSYITLLSTLNTYGSVVQFKAALLIEVLFVGLLILIWKTAFSPGSSKHGKALRASVG